MPLHKSWFILDYKLKKLSGFKDSEARFPQALAEKFISEYSKKGDRIFDPFAGFGTTLFAAKKLARIGYGIEYDEGKINHLQKKITSPHHIFHGSALNIDSMKLPKMDFCFTSPPYMRSFDKENPLSNYTKPGIYKKYLKDMGKIYAQIQKIMAKDAAVIIEISNTFDKNHQMTPLAWDVGKEIAKYLHFERDFIFCFKNGKLSSKSDNDNHSYCLMFRNTS